MTKLIRHSRSLFIVLSLSLGLVSQPSLANGEVGEHVNNLHAHLSQYTEEVSWLVNKFDAVVDSYEKAGKDANTDVMIEYWEEVDFHAAIETNYVPVYALIWQGIYGVKQAIDQGVPVAKVREEQLKLEQALFQALGAVKLAAQYQQQGLLAKVQTTETEMASGPQTLEEIKHQLDRVVAKYAEKLVDVATTMVHDTYLQRFEGVEGALIEQDAALVESLEKDFNVTLPKALQAQADVEEVRQIVQSMQAKLHKAKALLEKAEKNRQDVF